MDSSEIEEEYSDTASSWSEPSTTDLPGWVMRIGKQESAVGEQFSVVGNVTHKVQFRVPYSIVTFYKLSEPKLYIELIIGYMHDGTVDPTHTFRAELNTQRHIESYAVFEGTLAAMPQGDYWYKVRWSPLVRVDDPREAALKRESRYAVIQFSEPSKDLRTRVT